eukprot:757477-Rhodomonas_salina.2
MRCAVLTWSVCRYQGVLRFQPAPDFFGDSVFTISLVDNGGTLSPGGNAAVGSDRSPPVELVVSVVGINDPPLFTLAEPQVCTASCLGLSTYLRDLFACEPFFSPVLTSRMVRPDCATYERRTAAIPRSTPRFAYAPDTRCAVLTFAMLRQNSLGTSAQGPGAREIRLCRFRCGRSQPSEASTLPKRKSSALYFSQAPFLDEAGTLTFEVAPTINGVVRVTFALDDGQENNNIYTQSVEIIVFPVNQAPAFDLQQGNVRVAASEKPRAYQFQGFAVNITLGSPAEDFGQVKSAFWSCSAVRAVLTQLTGRAGGLVCGERVRRQQHLRVSARSVVGWDANGLDPAEHNRRRRRVLAAPARQRWHDQRWQ